MDWAKDPLYICTHPEWHKLNNYFYFFVLFCFCVTFLSHWGIELPLYMRQSDTP